MKYILWNANNIIFFPENVGHREILEALQPLIKKAPKSAGFVTIQQGEVRCFGESISLGIAFQDEDVITIKRYIEKTYQENELDI